MIIRDLFTGDRQFIDLRIPVPVEEQHRILEEHFYELLNAPDYYLVAKYRSKTTLYI